MSFVPLSERGYDEKRLDEDEPLYWPTWVFVLRSDERVCLATYLDGQLTEVSGPVEAP